MTAIALIQTDLKQTPLGLPARVGEQLRSQSILAHTVRRAMQIERCEHVVVVHPQDQDVAPLLDGLDVKTHASNCTDPRFAKRWHSARKWATRCWRGGLGDATVFDECLPAAPLVEAMEAFDAQHAILLRDAWCMLDPELCSRILKQHTDQPEAMKACFSQAPPGIAGIATSRTVLEQLRDHHAAFANVLGYNPTSPQMDPVGKDVNLAIEADVRDTYHRLIYDTPRSVNLIERIAAQLGDDFDRADAATVTCAARELGDNPDLLPDWITLELTPRRSVTGPITPQHYIDFERPDLDTELAERIIQQLPQDAAVMLGGLGDALLHPYWDVIVQQLVKTGVRAIGVETDLLCDQEALQALLALPIDLVVVRLNADRAQTYEQVMGKDAFKQVLDNLQWLFSHRNERTNAGDGTPGLPWIVPSMVKTAETLGDLEGFFDKWTMVSGHALLDGPRCGCGLMPDQSVVPMTPPLRHTCRQLGRRMTILSNGHVAQCDQDWQGKGAFGDANIATLDDIWKQHHELLEAHEQEQFTKLTLCGECTQWYRP